MFEQEGEELVLGLGSTVVKFRDALEEQDARVEVHGGVEAVGVELEVVHGLDGRRQRHPGFNVRDEVALCDTAWISELIAA